MFWGFGGFAFRVPKARRIMVLRGYALGYTSKPKSNLGHFQVGRYGYRSLIEGLYTLWRPCRSPIYPKLPTCSLFKLRL